MLVSKTNGRGSTLGGEVSRIISFEEVLNVVNNIVYMVGPNFRTFDHSFIEKPPLCNVARELISTFSSGRGGR